MALTLGACGRGRGTAPAPPRPVPIPHRKRGEAMSERWLPYDAGPEGNSPKGTAMMKTPLLRILLMLSFLGLLGGCIGASPDRPATSAPGASPSPTQLPTATPVPTAAPELIRLLGLGDRLRLSADGRWGVGMDRESLFLWDAGRGVFEPLRMGPEGQPAAGLGPALSADGRFLAFFARSPLPASAADPDCYPLAVYDRLTGGLEWLPGGVSRMGLAGHAGPALSADGRWIAWANDSACNPGPGVYLYDRYSQRLHRVHPPTESPAASGGDLVALSADGRFLAFVTNDDGVVPEDRNGQFDVFLYDRETGKTVWVSRPVRPEDPPQPSGLQLVPGTDGAWEGGIALSADGRFLAFAAAARLVDRPLKPCAPWPGAEPLPFCRHIYLYDRETGQMALVDANAAGEPGDGAAEGPAISGDGRWVVFATRARNLGSVGATECPARPVWGRPCDLWLAVWDRATGRVTILSRGEAGRLAGPSYNPVLSADGRWLAWVSEALEWVATPPPLPQGRPADFLYLAEREALLRLSGGP
jgi:Tol biopolymer transport system component